MAMNGHVLKVDKFFVPDFIEQKRDCYQELADYVYGDYQPVICALYGLRRTGKTVLMEQAAQSLDERGIPCLRLVCEEGSTMDELERLLDGALKQGIRHVFIDELTQTVDFQSYASVLANVYAAQGMRVVVTGTDSLGISLAAAHPLLDRVKKIRTSYIPYGEYHRLLGKGLDDFIAYGGTLTNAPYKPGQDLQAFYEEYFNSAIVSNIIHSLERNEGTRRYPPELTELYEREEIVSAINKMIGLMNHTMLAKAISRDFQSYPFHTTLNNVDRRSSNSTSQNGMAREFRYRDVVDIVRVDNAVREALKIKTNLELTTRLTDWHVKRLKDYLIDLGLLLVAEERMSLKNPSKDVDLGIILQPGMVYAHMTELRRVLEKDDFWEEIVAAEDKDDFILRADRCIKGIILENAVLANTILNYKDDANLYVSQLTLEMGSGQHEADMIVVDKVKDQTYLFEVKYSEGVYDSHLRHLKDSGFSGYIEENFGEIVGRYLIYNGDTGIYNDVHHVNVDDFFNAIYYYKDNWQEALRVIDGLALAGGLLELTPPADLKDRIADAAERAGEAPRRGPDMEFGK